MLGDMISSLFWQGIKRRHGTRGVALLNWIRNKDSSWHERRSLSLRMPHGRWDDININVPFAREEKRAKEEMLRCLWRRFALSREARPRIRKAVAARVRNSPKEAENFCRPRLLPPKAHINHPFLACHTSSSSHS